MQRLKAAAAVMLLASPSALALEWNGLVGFGVWQSDNETRSSSTEREETTFEPIVGLSLRENTAALQIDANYTAQRRLFKNDTFNDLTIVTGTGSLYWEALPNRFDLTVLQNNTESTNQFFARGDQGSRQEVRTTEATPRLRFRVRGTDELQFSYRYRNLSQERFDVASETQDLIGRYQIGLSERTQLNLEYINGDTEYDVATAPELERRIVQATYSVQGDRSNFQLTGGESEFVRTGREDTDGFTGNLLWTYNLANNSTMNLNIRRAITDGSDQFLNRGQGLDPAVPGVQPGNTDLIELFTTTGVRGEYRFAVGANQFTVSASYVENDFEDLPRDEERQDIGITWNRNLRRNLRSSVNLRHLDGSFEQLTSAAFDQIFANVGVFWEPVRNFEIIFRAQYVDRDGAAIAGNFDETRVYVGVIYEFGKGQGVTRTIRTR
ncbi:MAG: hypothetical protein AAGG11_11185 [Pseudomonadota bacterium]